MLHCGAGFGLGFLLSKELNSKVCSGTVRFIHQLSQAEKVSLLSSSNLELPRH